MDPVGFAIHRAAGALSPALRADLQWRRSRAANDFAMLVVEALVQRGEVVVDVGAAWGLYACRLARSVGRHGKVYAFEPNPTYQRPLQRLARRFPQLQVHSVALSSQAGDAALHVPHIADRMINEMATAIKTMEYMAFALPVVAFEGKETRRSAADAAVYADSDDPATYAAAVRDLLHDPARRAEMGRIGRRRVAEELAWEHQAKRYLEVYHRVLPQDGASPAARPGPETT